MQMTSARYKFSVLALKVVCFDIMFLLSGTLEIFHETTCSIFAFQTVFL